MKAPIIKEFFKSFRNYLGFVLNLFFWVLLYFSKMHGKIAFLISIKFIFMFKRVSILHCERFLPHLLLCWWSLLEKVPGETDFIFGTWNQLPVFPAPPPHQGGSTIALLRCQRGWQLNSTCKTSFHHISQ